MGIKQKLFDLRSKIGKLTKDTNNPFYKSKYADINQLIEMTDPLLKESNILILQPIRNGKLVTELTDMDSEEVITSEIDLPQSNDPQKTGIAITYYRRYSLKSLLNIQEEDTDGNSPSPKLQEEDTRPWLNENQFNNYLALINKGEKWLTKVEKKYKMKKVFKDTLSSAEKNYKPQP